MRRPLTMEKIAAPHPLQKSQPTPRLHRVIYLRDLLRELVGREIKLRYKRSFLGLSWSLLHPLAQLLVFTLVFRTILPLNIPNYPAFLFTGLLAWTWFQSSLHHATGAIVNNPELIKRPGFPTAILPIVTVCNHLIHYLLALPILLIFLWIVGLKPDATLLALPLLLLLQFLFILGLAYLAATLHVVFRDTEHLLVIALFLLFYLSPVFYDVQLLPEYARRLFALNPLVHLLEAHRSILLEQRLPDWPPLLLLALFSTLLLAGSYRLFNKMSDSFVEEL
jgi:lipopolysaccharide transport system permease protein